MGLEDTLGEENIGKTQPYLSNIGQTYKKFKIVYTCNSYIVGWFWIKSTILFPHLHGSFSFH